MLAPEPVDGVYLALLCDCDPRAVGLDEPYGLDGDFAPLRRLREDRRRVVFGIVAYRYRADERVDAIVESSVRVENGIAPERPSR